MRLRYLILIAGTAMLISGCSLFIARSGKDLSKLTTKEEVHREFGEPVETGAVEGHPCEDYCTRRKISEPVRSNSLGLGIAMTFGTAEVVAFPMELCFLCRRTVLGQSLRFAYDDNGQVMRVFLEGEKLDLGYNLDGWAVEEYYQKKKPAEAPNQQPADFP
jgi:hypothetical protein